MITLAFDTCLDACSVALVDGAQNTVLASRHVLMNRGQAEALFPLIDETVKEAGLAPTDLEQIAVTCGPGTFTGVRIGVAAARGLALSSNLPVVGLTSLQAIALCTVASQAPSKPVASVIDARRDELYLGLYGPDGTIVRAPVAVPLADAAAQLGQEAYVLAGSGARLIADQLPHCTLSPNPDLPEARLWAPMAAQMPAEATPPLPIYLRAPDAKPPAADATVRRAVEPS